MYDIGQNISFPCNWNHVFDICLLLAEWLTIICINWVSRKNAFEFIGENSRMADEKEIRGIIVVFTHAGGCPLMVYFRDVQNQKVLQCMAFHISHDYLTIAIISISANYN